MAIRLTSLLGPGAGDVVSEPTDSAEPEAALESVAVVETDAAFFPFLSLGAGFGLWNFFGESFLGEGRPLNFRRASSTRLLDCKPRTNPDMTD